MPRKVPENVKRALAPKKDMMDSHETKWEFQCEALVKYKQEYGDCEVPSDYIDKKLSNWVMNQRFLYLKNALPIHRLDKLNSLGFSWKSSRTNQRDFDEWIDTLVRYKETHGTMNPRRSPDDPENRPLAEWVCRIRDRFNKKDWSYLTKERMEKLNAIGFIFNVEDAAWEAKYQQMVEFQRVNGHCRHPHAAPLGQWVKLQRRKRRMHTLREDRFQKLDAIGFSWGRADESSTSPEEDPVQVSSRSKAGLGMQHLIQAAGEESAPPFGASCQILGSQLQFGSQASQESFDPAWEGKFQELVVFRNQNGHTMAQPHTSLGTWAKSQRTLFRQDKLDRYKVGRLTSIGFSWGDSNDKALNDASDEEEKEARKRNTEDDIDGGLSLGGSDGKDVKKFKTTSWNTLPTKNPPTNQEAAAQTNEQNTDGASFPSIVEVKQRLLQPHKSVRQKNDRQATLEKNPRAPTKEAEVPKLEVRKVESQRTDAKREVQLTSAPQPAPAQMRNTEVFEEHWPATYGRSSDEETLFVDPSDGTRQAPLHAEHSFDRHAVGIPGTDSVPPFGVYATSTRYEADSHHGQAQSHHYSQSQHQQLYPSFREQTASFSPGSVPAGTSLAGSAMKHPKAEQEPHEVISPSAYSSESITETPSKPILRGSDEFDSTAPKGYDRSPHATYESVSRQANLEHNARAKNKCSLSPSAAHSDSLHQQQKQSSRGRVISQGLSPQCAAGRSNQYVGVLPRTEAESGSLSHSAQGSSENVFQGARSSENRNASMQQNDTENPKRMKPLSVKEIKERAIAREAAEALVGAARQTTVSPLGQVTVFKPVAVPETEPPPTTVDDPGRALDSPLGSTSVTGEDVVSQEFVKDATTNESDTNSCCIS